MTKQNKKGFTLVELLIYLGIVSGLLIVAGAFTWSIIKGSVKTSCLREVQQNGRLAMEVITREIKAASGINSPLAGLSENTLSLVMSDSSLNPTVFELSNDQILLSQGVDGPYALTTDQVLVSTLNFTNLSYVDTPGTIRIEMTLDYNNLGDQPEYEASVDLITTVSLTGE